MYAEQISPTVSFKWMLHSTSCKQMSGIVSDGDVPCVILRLECVTCSVATLLSCWVTTSGLDVHAVLLWYATSQYTLCCCMLSTTRDYYQAILERLRVLCLGEVQLCFMPSLRIVPEKVGILRFKHIIHSYVYI